jgi:adhesin transport system membrane fusion protein
MCKREIFVKAGDTIVYISEVKSEYFDPELVERTAEQVSAKSQSITSYEDKMNALENQFRALEEGRLLKQQQIENKIEQARNKIRIDSIDLIAYRANLEIALNQVARTQELYDKGLKSLSELQEKQLKIQEVQAKVTVQENKLLNQKNEFLNLKIQLSSVGREYADKLAKSRSERQSAMSGKFEAVAETSKLRNKLSNYSLRQAFYFITAPQSGYITKTIQKGVGEIVKEGTDIATIMPDVYDLAVEVYVKPQDLPLLKQGEGVRLRFDGWPAIVISGWPEASTGIFDGEISAIDQFISDNGYYRILIVPDNHRKIWPEQLRFGTGANTFILLNDVPLWYEVWRQLNGFPPDFYGADDKENEVKLKAPLKSVK